jgi:tetratricopeptide (TPR) repeat protein
MQKHDVYLISLDIRKWDLDRQRLHLKVVLVADNREYLSNIEISLTQPNEMIEEFLDKLKIESEQKIRNGNSEDSEFTLDVANENFVRQRVQAHFKKILAELNNPKRKKGRSRMIYSTHLDVYTENQDIAFLPVDIQFYIILNWVRKYYEKEEYSKAVDPLRRLLKIRPDYGIAYKWLARSLKKIRKYEDAMRNYELYAEVDNSLDAWLDLAKSYRKGKLFDKSEEIYRRILQEDPQNREVRIGLAQIYYARLDNKYLEILDSLFEEDSRWTIDWIKEEFNFRIYEAPKTAFSPIQASRYLGLNKVFELTQMAFRNEVPSHFNPSRARMSFFKEELDQWALVMNRYNILSREVILHPENVTEVAASAVQGEEEEPEKKPVEEKKIEGARSARVEKIIRQIREARAQRLAREQQNAGGSESPPPAAEAPKKRRGRPPRKKNPADDGKNDGQKPATKNSKIKDQRSNNRKQKAESRK